MPQTAIQSYYTQKPSSIEEIEEMSPAGPTIWKARAEYKHTSIDDLQPGPGCISITGRITHLHEMPSGKGAPKAAKGFFKLCVRDETAAITVRLWYINASYNLRLGQLVKVFSPHVSRTSSGVMSFPSAPSVVTICPESDASTNFQLMTEAECEAKTCRRSLDPIEKMNLMTLKTFVSGGHEVVEAIVLVCVKSKGLKVMRTINKGKKNE